MKLTALLKNLKPLSVTGTSDIEISGLCYDSRQVSPGNLFFALKGVASDGHKFLGKAVESGAVAVVVEDSSGLPPDITSVVVKDSRLAMSLVAAVFYGQPTAVIPVVGITGTNGKTTTTYLVEAILEAAGIPAAVLGTVSYRFRQDTIPAPHTTPESVDLQRVLRQMVDSGAKSVVMEVSSHALEQKRVDGCMFDVGIFTNLTRDHLDYHGNMESYLESKLRLFTELLHPDSQKPLRWGVVNLDDSYGHIIAARATCPVITYGLAVEADVTARNINFSIDGIRGELVTRRGTEPFLSPLLGRFNMSNILAAVAAGTVLDIPLGTICSAIGSHSQVPGRMERVMNTLGLTVLVDYAHTSDALENVLITLKEFAPSRVITVFGCGGDRDRGKRPLMGSVAVRYSDLSVITSDNPRSEDPFSIIDEVREGILPMGIREYVKEDLSEDFRSKGFIAVENRRDAIRLAITHGKQGDIILLAGKGHEDYQIIGGMRHHFDDREEAAVVCRELEKN